MLFTLAQSTDVIPAPGNTIQPQPGTELGPEVSTEAPQSSIIQYLIPIMLVGFVVMMIVSSRKQKKQQAKLLEGLQNGKKATTIGGIVGVVHEVRDNEVVLKVDESSNTRMTFERAAIKNVG